MGIKRLMFYIGWNYKAEMLWKLDLSKSIGLVLLVGKIREVDNIRETYHLVTFWPDCAIDAGVYIDAGWLAGWLAGWQAGWRAGWRAFSWLGNLLVKFLTFNICLNINVPIDETFLMRVFLGDWYTSGFGRAQKQTRKYVNGTWGYISRAPKYCKRIRLINNGCAGS